EAAKIGGVGLQIIRDWVLRFNARGPDGLLDGKSTGQPSKLNDTQRQAIAGMIESGPIPAVHGVGRWRPIDLAQWIFDGIRTTTNRNAAAQRGAASHGLPQPIGPTASPCASGGRNGEFKKTSPARREEIARKKALARNTKKIWSAAGPRTGQKNKTPRRWAKR